MFGEEVAQGLDVWAPGLVCIPLFCLYDLVCCCPGFKTVSPSGSLWSSLLSGAGLASGPRFGCVLPVGGLHSLSQAGLFLLHGRER